MEWLHSWRIHFWILSNFLTKITLKNRVVIPPLTECMAFHDGNVTEDEIDYYRKHSGGVGLYSITAVANVNEEGKGFEGEPGTQCCRR